MSITISYEWDFGDDKKLADKLKRLVLSGRKTATTGLYNDLLKEGKEAPRPGDYAAILGNDKKRFCTIRYTHVQVRPFLDVDLHYIKKEGEGDRTVEQWREKHRRFFSYDPSFDDGSLVVCEEFKLISEENHD